MGTDSIHRGTKTRTAIVVVDVNDCPHSVTVPIEHAIKFRIAMLEHGLRVVQSRAGPPHFGLLDSVTFYFQDQTDADKIRAALEEWKRANL